MSELPKEVIDFLRKEKSSETYKEGDITAVSAMGVWECSRWTANQRLNQMVDENKLTKHWVKLPSGRHSNVYRVVKENKE